MTSWTVFSPPFGPEYVSLASYVWEDGPTSTNRTPHASVAGGPSSSSSSSWKPGAGGVFMRVTPRVSDRSPSVKMSAVTELPTVPEIRTHTSPAMNALMLPMIGSTLSTLTVTNRWLIWTPPMVGSSTGMFRVWSKVKPMSSSMTVKSTV